MSNTPDDSWTLGKAKQWLRERLDEGEPCPCCTQMARVYHRPIHATMVYDFLRVYRAAGGANKPICITDVLGKRGSSDWAKLRYWGLIEHVDKGTPNKPRAGWWKVTEFGEEFALKRKTVPKHARIYNGRCLSLDRKEYVSVEDALGQKFSYQDIFTPVP